MFLICLTRLWTADGRVDWLLIRLVSRSNKVQGIVCFKQAIHEVSVSVAVSVFGCWAVSAVRLTMRCVVSFTAFKHIYIPAVSIARLTTLSTGSRIRTLWLWNPENVKKNVHAAAGEPSNAANADAGEQLISFSHIRQTDLVRGSEVFGGTCLIRLQAEPRLSNPNPSEPDGGNASNSACLEDLRLEDWGGGVVIVNPTFKGQHDSRGIFEGAHGTLVSSALKTNQKDTQLLSGTRFPFFSVAAPQKMVFPKKGSLFFPGPLSNGQLAHLGVLKTTLALGSFQEAASGSLQDDSLYLQHAD